MNRQEITYLAQELLKNQVIDPEIVGDVAQIFISSHSEKISSFEYSAKGISDISQLISDWKTTDVGKKFLTPEPSTNTQPNPNKQRMTTKEMAQRIKDGTLKFENPY